MSIKKPSASTSIEGCLCMKELIAPEKIIMMAMDSTTAMIMMIT